MRGLLLLAALAVSTPALAGQAVTLKADPSDADGMVTLGDVFDGAGSATNAPLGARTGTSVMLDALAVQAAARRAGLDWPNAEGLRRIVVRAGGAAPGVPAARGNVEVLTWARSIAAGEVVQPEDLIWGKAALAPADAPGDPDALIGMAARRPLRVGAVATLRDVSALQVVRPGEVITLVFEADGISLSLQAKALSGGAAGDTINVQNAASKKIVQAVVAGPGQAVVGPAADRLKLARPSRIAAR